MKIKIFVIFLISIAFYSCKEDNSLLDNKVYTTVKGNTYVAQSTASWELGMYIIYKMDNDSTIDVEERMYSVDGELKNKSKGYFKFKYPVLELRVQSITGCDDCFNFFTATVNSDLKSFNYSIWDMGASKNKIMLFKIKK